MIKKRRTLMIFVLFVMTMVFFCFYWYYSQLDTRIAVEFGDILNNCNIEELDDYLCDTTQIVYRNRMEEYKRLRNNVSKVFEKKCIEAADSYGYSKDSMLSREKTIGITYFVLIDGLSYENYAEIKVEMNYIGKNKIKEIRGDDRFFGYLFYGEG